MQEYFAFAHQHLPEALQDVADLCAVPSMAGRPEALGAAADWVADALERAGLKVQLFANGAAPIVLGERLVPGKPTVLFYNHYDVQPPGDEHDWRFPPFAPRQYRRRLYARGAVDNKGALLARIWALRACQQVRGSLPVGVRFLVEGEEEVGSPHLPAFVEAHADRLRADGCIWESGGVSSRGRPYLYLGMKGLLSVELSTHGAAQEVHSGWATVAPNPAWRLAWALARIKSSNEEVLIDGFYDEVEGPTRDEIDAARRIPFPEKDLLRAWDIPAFLQGLAGGPFLLCQFYSPTCNIAGLESGETGPVARTIVPASARARLDFRLVPRQRPEEILRLLRRYLEEDGFGDVTVRAVGPALNPFRTSPDDPFARAVVEATRTVYRHGPLIMPTAGGSGPMYLVGQGLGLPIISLGVGHPEENIHGPNENLRLGDLERGIVHVVAVLERLGQGLS